MDADDSRPAPSPAMRVLARSDVRLTLGLLLPLLVALYQLWQFHTYTIDDAFISFRYARNLIDGHGLVYNLGERVEGYTNFSWTMLIAAALAAGVDPEWFTAVLGGAFGLGTIVLTYRLAERLLPMSPVPCVATWLLASSPGACGHAVFGLETSMFAFLIVAGILAFLREEDDARRRPWSGLIFALAGLTRPEAPLFFGLLMLHLGGRPLLGLEPLARLGRRVFGGEDHAWRGPALFVGVLAVSLGVTLVQRDTGRADTAAPASIALLLVGAVLVVLTAPRSLFARRNLLRIQLFLVPTLIHLMWRFDYYGQWLPNTLTAKTGDSAVQFADGTGYFDYYIGDVEGPLVWFVFAACGLAIAKREGVRLAFASMVAAFCSYVMLVGGDWMILGRYFVPLLPVFYVLLDVAARELLVLHRATMWGVLLAVPFVIHQRVDVLGDSRRIFKNERDYWNDVAGGTAQWFVDQEREHGEAARGTIATGDIGRVGWQTGFPIFDVLGLVEPTTAQFSGGHRQRTGDDFLDHFYGTAPRYYLSGTTKARCHEGPGSPVLRAIQKDPRFARTYRLRARIYSDARKNMSWCIFELAEHSIP
jgi:arabinofuranosyltransferase